jgi:plasmid replication initiation protein
MAAVIKHSATIQMSNKVGLLARKAWNVLLRNAYPDLRTKDRHKIRVKDLARILGFESNDYAVLKKALTSLAETVVEWNLLDKDRQHEWAVSSLLAQALIKRGVCEYAYSPFMREVLSEPNMYARINLRVQNKIRSKHSLALYELLIDYFNRERRVGETPWIEVEQLRALLGAKGKYPAFSEFNHRIIKHAAKEVSEVARIKISIQYMREDRSVAYVKFVYEEKRGVTLKPSSVIPFPSKDGEFHDYDDLAGLL